MLPERDDGEDLEVVGTCIVGRGTYTYGNVNIFEKTPKTPGVLRFRDATITFSAKSILVENNGYLLAGWSSMMGKPRPIGTNSGSKLTIRLYGSAGDTPISCKSGSMCGVDPDIWNSNADPTKPPVSKVLDNGVSDYFYNYDVMPLSEREGTPSYFGQKVLAVSYGGTLLMFGKRGAIYPEKDNDPSNSGRSWRRLDGSLKPDDKMLVVDGVVDWRKGDHIVVTTTDYLPAHSEELIVTGAIVNHGKEQTRIRFTKATCPPDEPECGVTYHHWGEKYSLSKKDHPGIDRLKLNIDSVDTRAAVALLSRSIRIISAGDTAKEKFPPESTGYSFGGHTVVRQGFRAYQMQGVELYQAGQGGRIGHYPVHFHMVRKTPSDRDTFVKDCSIHDSMTRWITLHATQGVLLARNVGYLSIGHGYYIEDGTETDNKLYSNIGIFARAAVQGPPADDGSVRPGDPNPRKVPGILSAAFTDRPHRMPYHSDSDTPSVFWIMNGWNDFQYNFAAGAGSCGVCYWLVPGYNSGRENSLTCYNPDTKKRGAPCLNLPPPEPPDKPECVKSSGEGFVCAPYSKMAWTGYAAMQGGINDSRAGMTPLKSFVGNTCTSAMNSFQVVGEFADCNGVEPLTNKGDIEHLEPIRNPLAPPISGQQLLDVYYPRVPAGASRPATRCGDDPSKVNAADCSDSSLYPKCASNALPPPPPNVRAIRNCMVTVLDRYTTSFNWAATNFAAIWLRQFWFVLSNSAITDVQNGGITFVTGGDYTRGSVIDGVWSVAAKSAFVGHTQPDPSKDPNANPFAADVGPFNPRSGLQCPINDLKGKLPNHCIEPDSGVDFEVANFATNQRLFSIYDGPSYEDSNAYLDIVPTKLPDLASQCQPTQNDSCPAAMKLYGRLGGMPKNADGTCYLPNAAIGWKQPNGFFYPPAFHSQKLYFHNASDDPEIRHFVILPEFEPGTLKIDPKRVKARYCTYPITGQSTPLFDGFTDIDRQTVLNDDDGSLTGLLANPDGASGAIRETISVNFDTYFNAPIEALECNSDVPNPPPDFPPGTAKTSPYEYLTTAIYPACARQGGPPAGEPVCGRNYPPNDPPLQNPNWDSTCANPMCYGVPLYRQGLTSAEQPNTHAIRMMGGDLWQRSTLTANNGVYYMDTAAGPTKQADSPKKNIFEADRTYYILFVYATPTTHQTYQLWVGAGLPADWAEQNVWLARVFPETANFRIITKDDDRMWPPGWERTYDPGTGILTVTIDMGFEPFKTEYLMAQQHFCLPTSFCTLAEDKGCKCNPKSDFVDICEDNDLCGKWAGKDVDWPDGGVYAFRLKFPSTFVADDQDHRPTPRCLRQSDPGWNAPLIRAPDELLGDCAETPIDPPKFCPG